MKLKVLRRYSPEYGRCESCGEMGTMKKQRSKNFADKILKAFSFRAYACRNCYFRKRYFSYRLTQHWVKSTIIYFLIIVFTIFMVFYYLSKIV